VVGAGYLGAAVARQAQKGGWEVEPVVRSKASVESLCMDFPNARAGDALESSFWGSLSGNWQGLVWSLSPSRSQETSFNELHRVGTILAGSWCQQHRVPMVYISSTSVYAESTGGWVDETSPVALEDARSMAMVEAEKVVQGSGGSVLRCAGIYGPNRDLRAGSEGPERWLNVVQVEDAARAVGLVLGGKSGVYNICENEPLRRGTPDGRWPVGRKERRNKRVRNAKLRDLGWRPLWKAGCLDSV